jgi:Zn-dependent peptidase ImmA (M78 family)
VIVENDGHALIRRRASIAHEMGHHLLEHSFDSVILGEDHKRQFDKTQEKQAGFMAGELLVTLRVPKTLSVQVRRHVRTHGGRRPGDRVDGC